MNEAILVVEDERRIARLLQIELESEGYEVRLASDGVDGWGEYKAGGIALIILDVMLPGISGLDLLQRIRAVDSDTPIIMLTANSTVSDKVTGLDLGANDYMTKPFEMEELLARIRASFRKGSARASDEQHVGEWLTASDLRLNERTREVERAGQAIALTQREFDLLTYLLRNKKLVLSRDQLLAEVWGYDYAGNTNVVDVYIRYVRKKVDEGFGAELIHTVRGIGYCIKDAT
ncbi:DNA-binding response OmpR family regulator [Paenibacillus endophyticus]|uniref:DNA-binding response OmpR family regulator n=1 Tax=Paenibacillus endophyticus TaxID=1294268 RepID=A0A7W5C3E6_9BACL|nr:response regulator transcription factor [Paenibacillus endophyticus]MBB3150351.1 DNA-binding response OmpR family regulator [Paenibacillus endophyticus]